MSDAYAVETIPNLEGFGNVVPEGYTYYKKLVTPREDLSLPNVYLKWYDIRPADVEITEEQFAECRAFVAAEAQRLKFANELGFVLLHRAGPVLLLMINTWRNTNEIWESVYVPVECPTLQLYPFSFALQFEARYYHSCLVGRWVSLECCAAITAI